MADSLENSGQQASYGRVVSFHVHHNDQTYGPYTLAELNDYLSNGTLDTTSLVFDTSLNSWVAISDIWGIEIPVPYSSRQQEDSSDSGQKMINLSEESPVSLFSTRDFYIESVDDLIDMVTIDINDYSIVTSSESRVSKLYRFWEIKEKKSCLNIRSTHLKLELKELIGEENLGSLPGWVGSKQQVYKIIQLIVTALLGFVIGTYFFSQYQQYLLTVPETEDPLTDTIFELGTAVASAIVYLIVNAFMGKKDLNLDVGIITPTHFIILDQVGEQMYSKGKFTKTKPKKSIGCNVGIIFNRRYSVFDVPRGILGREIKVEDGNSLADAKLKFVNPKHAKRLITRNLNHVIDWKTARKLLIGK